MRALVTGCAGFIGSHLADSLLADGHEVLGIDCFNDNYRRAPKLANLERARDYDGFEFVPIDLARGDLHDVVEECDTIFHLAAEPGVRSSWGDRFELYVRNNVLATQRLLEAAVAVPQRRVVYASSSSVYGNAAQLPTRESATPAPFSPYGVTKLGGEHLCSLYRDNHGLETVSLRYFTVYGS
jgi:nucleoside-diphosphate-sugar epimerase